MKSLTGNLYWVGFSCSHSSGFPNHPSVHADPDAENPEQRGFWGILERALCSICLCELITFIIVINLYLNEQSTLLFEQYCQNLVLILKLCCRFLVPMKMYFQCSWGIVVNRTTSPKGEAWLLSFHSCSIIWNTSSASMLYLKKNKVRINGFLRISSSFPEVSFSFFQKYSVVFFACQLKLTCSWAFKANCVLTNLRKKAENIYIAMSFYYSCIIVPPLLYPLNHDNQALKNIFYMRIQQVLADG